MVQYLSPATGDPRHWGPTTWDYLFLMASHFPHPKHLEDDRPITERHVEMIRKKWKRHLASVLDMLPCSLCKQHFEQYMQEHPVDGALRSRDALFEWLWNARADVRRKQGKKVIQLNTVKRRFIPRE